MVSTEELDLIPPTDPSLNQPAEEVKADEIASPDVQGLIGRMVALAMGKGYSKQDSRQMVGLAAPQIGCRKRIIIVDVAADGSLKVQSLRVFINPRITRRTSKTVPGREGCWSCGNICGNVERAQSITLEALDHNGKPIKLELTDFTARIAQHEIDHLDGIRFPDRIPEGHPEKLHWVKPKEFEAYREQWRTWPHLCSRQQWLDMKSNGLLDKAVDIAIKD